MSELPIELDETPEPLHDCLENRLEIVDHPVNSLDWSGPGSEQGYQVYRCRDCGDYWGCRYQYDPGTGSDDRWHRFGPDINSIKRHY